MTEFSELKIRNKIYSLIAKNPGLYISKIAEILNLKISEVESHLFHMEKRDLITSLQDAGYTLYYTKDTKAGIRDRRILKTRRKIYDCVAKNPGLHVSKISEILQMSVPLVDYHMHQLENDKLIAIVKGGGYKRCYIADNKIGINEKKIISLLREKTPLKIVLFLLKHPNAKHNDICNHLNIASSLLPYHMKKLIDQGIIDIPPSGKGFRIKNKKEIVRFLRRYHLRSITEKFTDTWDYPD